MVEPAMRIFVGDLEEHIGEAAVLDPIGHVDDAGSYRRFVAKNLVLPLIETAQNDDGAAPVTSLDDPPHAGQVGFAQRAVRLKRRIDRPFVSRHPALKSDCKSPYAMRDILGNADYKLVGIRI